MYIETDKCIACDLCRRECILDAIRIASVGAGSEISVKGIVIDSLVCICCHLCENVCPIGVIHIGSCRNEEPDNPDWDGGDDSDPDDSNWNDWDNWGGGGYTPPEPEVDEVKKEPCNEWKEMVKETDKRQRARNAIKCLLGMKAYPYIQFDANGKLNVSKLEEAKGIMHTSDVNQTNQDLYDALLFMAKDASTVITNLNGKVNVIVNGVNQEVTLEKIESLYNRYKDPEDRIKLLGYSVMKNREVYYTEERINYKGLPEVHQVTVSGSHVNKLHKQAIILGHELLGHMYMFLKGKHYKHPLGSGSMSKEEREFENYIKDIERQIRHNTREIKRAMKILPDCM